MIWKNQKLIFFCRWKQTGYWWGHHVELNISRRILTGCTCLFKCSLLLKLHILQLHLQLKLTCVYFTRTEKKSRILRKYMNFKGRIFILCGFSKKKLWLGLHISMNRWIKQQYFMISVSFDFSSYKRLMRQSRPNWFPEPHSPNTIIFIEFQTIWWVLYFLITENVKAEKHSTR